ncbi:MAG: DUF2029 domain-containing protein [Phycisphaerales bacterium]|nr:DUF2029 domain-containing protein [Phycisphaerales bacterium]
MFKHLTTLRNWIEPGTASAGWLAWLVGAIGAFVVGATSKTNSVTGNYRAAAHAWLHAEPMYFPGGDGWLYPPQSALLFVPVEWMPRGLGEGLWRCAWVVLMAWAVWRLTRLVNGLAWREASADVASVFRRDPIGPGALDAERAGHASRIDLFFLVSLLTIPACLGSIQNGQTNLPLGAAIVLACVSVAERRWWWCVAWCMFGLLCKPLMVVPILLVVACWPRALVGRMAVGLLVFAVLPMIHLDTRYALGQYEAGVRKVLEAGELKTRLFANLPGMLAELGVAVPEGVMTVVRVGSAGIVLGLCWLSARRDGVGRAALVTLALSTAYLMLMNPRTEGNSYCVLGPALAAWAGLWLTGLRRVVVESVIAGLLVGGCVLLGVAHLISGPVFGRGNDLTLRPVVAVAFAALVAWQVVAGRVFVAKIGGLRD